MVALMIQGIVNSFSLVILPRALFYVDLCA
jgi:hypothetical protein